MNYLKKSILILTLFYLNGKCFLAEENASIGLYKMYKDNTSVGDIKNQWDIRTKKELSCSTEDFPFLVAIMLDEMVYQTKMCGGTLLNAFWVLTAAHCLNVPNIVILAGLNSKTPIKRRAAWFFSHPNYNDTTLSNDIGLIRLSYPIQRSHYVNYISLPLQPIELEQVCQSSFIIRWGYTEKDFNILPSIHCAYLPILSISKCRIYYQQKRILFSTSICTLPDQEIDDCRGESGGALICGSEQVGVVSLGLGCGNPHDPKIYTRVDLLLDFIEITKRHRFVRGGTDDVNSSGWSKNTDPNRKWRFAYSLVFIPLFTDIMILLGSLII